MDAGDPLRNPTGVMPDAPEQLQSLDKRCFGKHWFYWGPKGTRTLSAEGGDFPGRLLRDHILGVPESAPDRQAHKKRQSRGRAQLRGRDDRRECVSRDVPRGGSLGARDARTRVLLHGRQPDRRKGHR